MPRTGYGFDQIGHCLGRWIKLDDEPFLSLLDMQGRCGIHKAEAAWGVHSLNDTVETHRPEAGGVNLHTYELSRSDLGAWVQNLNPAQIKLLPSEEGVAGGLESLQTSPNLSTRKIMHKALGRSSERAGCQSQQMRAEGRGITSGSQKLQLLVFARPE